MLLEVLRTKFSSTDADGIPSELNDDESNKDEVDLSEITDYAPISIQLGYGLVEMVDNNSGGPLVNRITGIRKQVSALGFVVPNVRIRDDLSLEANVYRMKLDEQLWVRIKSIPIKNLLYLRG